MGRVTVCELRVDALKAAASAVVSIALGSMTLTGVISALPGSETRWYELVIGLLVGSTTSFLCLLGLTVKGPTGRDVRERERDVGR